MKNDTVVSIDELETTRDALTEVQRERAQKLIAEAVQAELEELLEQYEGQEDEQGRQRLVRNGYLPQREVQTGIWGIPVRIPRVRDRGSGQESEEIIRFRSSLVPPYSEAQQESGGTVTSAVLERHLDGGLQRRSECPAGCGCPGVIS